MEVQKLTEPEPDLRPSQELPGLVLGDPGEACQEPGGEGLALQLYEDEGAGIVPREHQAARHLLVR